jgi:hypothetical protein
VRPTLVVVNSPAFDPLFSFFHRLEPVYIQALVGLLQARGLEAAVSPMESPDYVVSYVDKWYWDMRTYMIDFRVDIRNAETNELVATGRSFQTSVVDGRDTYDKIVEAALNTALVAPKTPKPAAKRRRVSS